jgi:putative ABC transport system permease protein
LNKKIEIYYGLTFEHSWPNYFTCSMIANYFTTLLRNFLRHRVYSLLNLVGLSLGMAACILILLYVTNQFSYDKYHSKTNRIYRIIQNQKEQKPMAWVGGGMAPMLKEEFPEFEKIASISNTNGIVSRKDAGNEISFKEEKIFYADPEWLDIFDVNFLDGSSKNSLDGPAKVIITEAIAKKYFNNEPALGKKLKIGKSEVEVSGVIENIPSNSHIHPDFILSMNTFKIENGLSATDQFSSFWWPFAWTYVLLKEGQSVATINDRLSVVIKKHRQEPEASNFIPALQPLKDIHFSDYVSEAEANGNLRLVYVFISIAFFLMLLACVNFMNLATARALKRSKEVGIRKVIGAKRTQLIFQFIGEAIILSSAALIVSLVLTETVLPFFNRQLNLQLFIPYNSISLWLSFTILVLLVGLLAGSYPAFYLSSFKPVAVLKGSSPMRMGGTDLRKGLVVFQFTVSITLLICSTIAYFQIDYLRNAKLGFNKEHIIVIDQLGAYTTYDAFVNKLVQLSSIKLVAGSNARPGIDSGWGPFTFESSGISAKDNLVISQQFISHDFFDLFDLKLVAGRKFDKNSSTDAGRMYLMRERFPAYEGMNYIINESAAKLLGKAPEQVLGLPMRIYTEENGLLFSDFKGNIVGVVKDYHSSSLREEIKPTAYLLGNSNYYGAVLVKLQAGRVTEQIATVQKIWKEINPTVPIKYSFLDEDINKQYQSEEQLGLVIGTFSGMVLFVACLGLFGLSAFTAEMKTKEIGIRKVLGASTLKIVTMLSREFMILVLFALGISIPAGWYISKIWLSEFAYRLDFSIWHFAGVGILCIIIAIFTISWQSFRAAIANPVESLKNE